MEKGNSPPGVVSFFFMEEEEIRESNLKVPLMDAGLTNSGLEKRANKTWLVNVSRFTTRNELQCLTTFLRDLLRKTERPSLSLSFFLLERALIIKRQRAWKRKTEATVTIYSFFYMYICMYAYF